MNVSELLKDLKNLPEMNPDEHDGSYELMRETVASYSKMSSYSECNYLDLNAIYMMAIGTWRLNVEKKKEYIRLSHLPEEEKERIVKVIDRIWNNACLGKFRIRVSNKPSIGLFVTGFYSFKDKTT